VTAETPSTVPDPDPGARVAVVTGASSGIGEATARLLARKGWHCVLVARREERLLPLAHEVGGEVELCDVGDREAVEAMAARVLERHPAVHLLVNNAGMPARGTFLVVDPDLVRRVIDVNYLGGVWCTRALLPGLRWAATAGTSAHIVNLVSVAGTTAFAPAGAYAASKHAQLAFSRSVGVELAGSGITVHTVIPGFIDTPGFPNRARFRSPLLQRLVADPDLVADEVVRGIERNRLEQFVPRWYRPAAIVQAAVPGLLARAARASGVRRKQK
jgi:NAD(P)-dependent dehydrogenase (short-subunit alcohol dehydrogenase family)